MDTCEQFLRRMAAQGEGDACQRADIARRVGGSLAQVHALLAGSVKHPGIRWAVA